MPLRDATRGIFEGVSMGPRLIALFLDAIVLILLLAITFVALFGFNLNVEFQPFGEGPLIQPSQMGWLDWVFTLFFPHGIILICWYAFGASLGKLYIGAFIVQNKTGQRPKWWQFIVRYAVLSTPYLAVLFTGLAEFFYAYLLYGLIWFNSRKRTLHDYVAGTVVVRMIGSDSIPIKFDKEEPIVQGDVDSRIQQSHVKEEETKAEI